MNPLIWIVVIIAVIVLAYVGYQRFFKNQPTPVKKPDTGSGSDSGSGSGSTDPPPVTTTSDPELGPNNPNALYTKSDIYTCQSTIDNKYYVVVADLVNTNGTYAYGTRVPNTYYIMYTASGGASSVDSATARQFAQSAYNAQSNNKVYSTDGSNSLFTTYIGIRSAN